jgi:hypothetical protein
VAGVELTFKCEPYFCEPCSLKQNTLVTELVRMIPKPYLICGKLTGDEFYCCPICFDPKFKVKGKTKVRDGARIKKKPEAGNSADPGTGRGGHVPSPSPLRLVSDGDHSD